MTKVVLHSVPSEVIEKGDGKSILTMGMHTPNIIAWAKSKFTCTKDSDFAYDLAKAFGVKPIVMIALLTGEVDYTVEGDTVVFEWPDEEVSDG